MFKLKRITSVLAILGLTVLVLSGCKNQTNKITAVGSTALQPLVEQAASDYQSRSNDKELMINIQGGGSGTGLSQVQQKAVTIGNSDVFAEQQKGIKANQLKDHKVAVVGITPIVNPASGVKNVTMTQLRDIFSGKITNWKQVGGKNVPITIVNRVSGSGTRKTFEQNVLGKSTAVKSQEQDSNGTVQKIVGSTPGAISYVSFFFLKNSEIQPLSIDGVKPSFSNIENNNWKIWSYEHMYTTKNPDQQITNFINYILSKKVQNELLAKMGYVSVHNMKVVKNANNIVTSK